MQSLPAHVGLVAAFASCTAVDRLLSSPSYLSLYGTPATRRCSWITCYNCQLAVATATEQLDWLWSPEECCKGFDRVLMGL